MACHTSERAQALQAVQWSLIADAVGLGRDLDRVVSSSCLLRIARLVLRRGGLKVVLVDAIARHLRLDDDIVRLAREAFGFRAHE